MFPFFRFCSNRQDTKGSTSGLLSPLIQQHSAVEWKENHHDDKEGNKEGLAFQNKKICCHGHRKDYPDMMPSVRYRQVPKSSSPLLTAVWNRQWANVLKYCTKMQQKQQQKHVVTQHSKRTALHLACFHASCPLNVIIMLVSTDPHAVCYCDNEGMTPLHYACAFGCKEATIQVLCEGLDMLQFQQEQQERNTCMNCRQKHEQQRFQQQYASKSPLWLACHRPSISWDVIEILINTATKTFSTTAKNEPSQPRALTWIAPQTGGEPYFYNLVNHNKCLQYLPSSEYKRTYSASSSVSTSATITSPSVFSANTTSHAAVTLTTPLDEFWLHMTEDTDLWDEKYQCDLMNYLSSFQSNNKDDNDASMEQKLLPLGLEETEIGQRWKTLCSFLGVATRRTCPWYQGSILHHLIIAQGSKSYNRKFCSRHVLESIVQPLRQYCLDHDSMGFLPLHHALYQDPAPSSNDWIQVLVETCPETIRMSPRPPSGMRTVGCEPRKHHNLDERMTASTKASSFFKSNREAFSILTTRGRPSMSCPIPSTPPPLTMLMQSGRSSLFCMEWIRLEPLLLMEPDSTTGLFPFMTAATLEAPVDIIYQLLRNCPQLLKL